MAEQTGALLTQVAAVLEARVSQRYFMFETYGPDGEILEATECWPLTAADLASDAMQAVTILMPDAQGRHAEPKRDWQERGVVPPRGFHRYRERQTGEWSGSGGEH